MDAKPGIIQDKSYIFQLILTDFIEKLPVQVENSRFSTAKQLKKPFIFS